MPARDLGAEWPLFSGADDPARADFCGTEPRCPHKHCPSLSDRHRARAPSVSAMRVAWKVTYPGTARPLPCSLSSTNPRRGPIRARCWHPELQFPWTCFYTVVTTWGASSTPGTPEHNQLTGEQAGCPVFFFFTPSPAYTPISTRRGVLCASPSTSSQHFSSQNCSCCDDVTKTDKTPPRCHARRRPATRTRIVVPRGSHTLPRAAAVLPEPGGELPIRARKRSRTKPSTGCRRLPAPAPVPPGLSAAADHCLGSGEAKIFGSSGRSGALHPGRVKFHGL